MAVVDLLAFIHAEITGHSTRDPAAELERMQLMSEARRALNSWAM